MSDYLVSGLQADLAALCVLVARESFGEVASGMQDALDGRREEFESADIDLERSVILSAEIDILRAMIDWVEGLGA